MGTAPIPGPERLEQRRRELLSTCGGPLREALVAASVPDDGPVVDEDRLPLPSLAWGAALRLEHHHFPGGRVGRAGTRLKGLKTRDLAWTLACEQRDEWRPAERPVTDRARAEESFGRLHRLLDSGFQARLRSQLSRPALPLDELAQFAWSKLVENHLQRQAPRPFFALSTITTWLVTVAYHQSTKKSPPWEPLTAANDEGVEDPTPSMEADELRRAVRAGLEALPPRQRLVVTLRLVERVRPSDIAKRLQTTRPNVTNLYTRGRETLQRFLETRGYSLEGEE